MKRSAFPFLPSATLLLAAAPAFAQSLPLVQRIGHYDPVPAVAVPRPPGRPGAHQGTGNLALRNLVDVSQLHGDWTFFQRGVLYPHSSIGEHFHFGTEEMFIILDGDAQFTIDGHTSVLRGPAAAPVRLTHAHAVYNPTDKPMQWLNVSVSAKNGGGNFENGDDRAGADVVLDRIPQFTFMRFDRELLQPVPQMNGGQGTAMYRRALSSGPFSTLWSYVDHFLLKPGASAGPVAQADISEIYYVISGAGTVTVNNETAPIKAGDGIPVDMGQTRSFTQTGSEPLEMFSVGVARNAAVKAAVADVTGSKGAARPAATPQ
jgi:mannose-6-phosphate isomerase-like protein (cupin superfamily)